MLYHFHYLMIGNDWQFKRLYPLEQHNKPKASWLGAATHHSPVISLHTAFNTHVILWPRLDDGLHVHLCLTDSDTCIDFEVCYSNDEHIFRNLDYFSEN